MDINFFDPAITADPYPYYEQVRAAGPVVYNAALGLWMMTDYQPIMEVLGDWRKFSAESESEGLLTFFGRTFMTTDGPPHNEQRAVWNSAFLKSNIERKASLIQEIADRLLDAFAARLRAGETVDAYHGLAKGLPTEVISALLGVPLEMREQFHDWSDSIADAMAALLDPAETREKRVAAAVTASADMGAFLADEIARRRRQPADDLIGQLVASGLGETLPVETMVANCRLLLFAGNETTGKWLATAIAMLGQDEGLRHRLTADPGLMPRALEEILRLESVAQGAFRSVRQGSGAAIIAGVEVPEGATLMLLQGAANRDPARYQNPAAFDLDRPVLPHLGFGYGMHSCLGLNLARLEGRILLDGLLQLVPEFGVVTPLDYGGSFSMRGPAAVPVYL